ncbi:hypothetical protein SAMN06265218_102139 [Fodinibius sediminis]|uniref:Uncharacterized protein n=1 Tax=Fodinibius sediminis TaxID=1214077 RepID=A0A521B2X8_9BACT|nr:hypothetical protein SAMN06265218_102139 [Fodinibius sediminis]
MIWLNIYLKTGKLTWHLNALSRLFLLETFGYKKTILFTEGPLKRIMELII